MDRVTILYKYIAPPLLVGTWCVNGYHTYGTTVTVTNFGMQAAKSGGHGLRLLTHLSRMLTSAAAGTPVESSVVAGIPADCSPAFGLGLLGSLSESAPFLSLPIFNTGLGAFTKSAAPANPHTKPRFASGAEHWLVALHSPVHSTTFCSTWLIELRDT